MPCIVIVPCLVDFVARQARAQRELEQRNAQFIEEQRAERRDEILELMRQQGVNEIRELDNDRFIALPRKWIRHKDWQWNPTSNFLASKSPGKRFAVRDMPKIKLKSQSKHSSPTRREKTNVPHPYRQLLEHHFTYQMSFAASEALKESLTL